MNWAFFIRVFIWAALIPCAAAFSACGPATDWEGKYVSRQIDATSSIKLILNGDGKGFWESEGESTPLRWEKRQGALWLHVKAGGVLVATPEGGDKTLTVDVPGHGRILFDPR